MPQIPGIILSGHLLILNVPLNILLNGRSPS